MTDKLKSAFETLMKERTFVRVYELPKRRELIRGYCFSGGNPIMFVNVDWFEAPVEDGRETVEAFIKTKRYYKPNCDYLVLGDHPDFVFRIEAAKDVTLG